MRTVLKSKEYEEFYNSLNLKVQEKIKYVLQLVSELTVVNTKFIKKLENTEFYELRVSTDNEYRIILFAMDDQNFQKATEVLLLNGFIKKSTKDYKRQIITAREIINKLKEDI